MKASRKQVEGESILVMLRKEDALVWVRSKCDFCQ